MLLELSKEQLGVLRRALEARVRDMHLRLGSDPGDEGFRREAIGDTASSAGGSLGAAGWSPRLENRADRIPAGRR
jgi:hypothetical protein